MKPPHLNIELVVDDTQVTFETQISMREEINSISAFTIGFGDQYNLRKNRIRDGSIVQILLSWGNVVPELYMTGIVTRSPKNISTGNIGVTTTGSHLSIRTDERQAWNNNYEYIEYTNRRASDILYNLMGFSPEVSANIQPYAGEPSLSWECSKGSSIFDNVKAVAEYSGYEIIMNPNGTITIRKILEETAANAKYMFLLGNKDDFSITLPNLPSVYIHNMSIEKDSTKIRNFYKVEGKDNIFGVGFNQFSINTIGRRIEGFHNDERLTSVQACQVAARTLSEYNGVASRPIEVHATGISEVHPGDVVYIASSQNRSDALPGYYRLLRKTSNIGAVGWRTTYTFGRLQRSLTDLMSNKL